jgi:hypothetical protein
MATNMYKKIMDMNGNDYAYGVCRTSDNEFVPFDPSSPDYQAYLQWVEEGNTPSEADLPPIYVETN